MSVLTFTKRERRDFVGKLKENINDLEKDLVNVESLIAKQVIKRELEAKNELLLYYENKLNHIDSKRYWT